MLIKSGHFQRWLAMISGWHHRILSVPKIIQFHFIFPMFSIHCDVVSMLYSQHFVFSILIVLSWNYSKLFFKKHALLALFSIITAFLHSFDPTAAQGTQKVIQAISESELTSSSCDNTNLELSRSSNVSNTKNNNNDNQQNTINLVK